MLLRRIWPAGHLARWALALWILAGIGKIIVGLVPENTHIGLHLLGALNDPLVSVAILLLSLAIRRTSHTIAVIDIVVAVVGLAGTVLSTGGEFAGSSAYLGLGVGGAERLASYPGSLWMLMIGIIAMFSVRTWQNFTFAAVARWAQRPLPEGNQQCLSTTASSKGRSPRSRRRSRRSTCRSPANCPPS